MQYLRPRLYFGTSSGSQASTVEGAETRVTIHFAAKVAAWAGAEQVSEG